MVISIGTGIVIVMVFILSDSNGSSGSNCVRNSNGDGKIINGDSR